MKNITYLFLMLAVVSILLSACGTIDKLSSKAGAQEVFFLNSDGNLVIVDGGKGKVVPPCNASDRKGFGDCKVPFDLSSFKESPDELKNALENSCKAKDCPSGFVKNVKSLLVIDHPGSTCRIIYDRATGSAFQICR